MPTVTIILTVLVASSTVTAAMAVLLRAQNPLETANDEFDSSHVDQRVVSRYVSNWLFGFSGMMLSLAAAIWLGNRYTDLRDFLTAPFAELSIAMTIAMISGIVLRSRLQPSRKSDERR